MNCVSEGITVLIFLAFCGFLPHYLARKRGNNTDVVIATINFINLRVLLAMIFYVTI